MSILGIFGDKDEDKNVAVNLSNKNRWNAYKQGITEQDMLNNINTYYSNSPKVDTSKMQLSNAERWQAHQEGITEEELYGRLYPNGKPESEKERGMIDKIFGTLGYTGVVEGLYNMVDDDDESTFLSGLGEGFKYMNPTNDDVSGRHLFSDVLKEIGWEDKEPDDLTASDVGRGVVGFMGDVLLDPITFLNPYSSAAKIVKGSGVGLDAAKQLTSATKIRKVSDAISAVKTGKVNVSDKTRMLTGISEKDALKSIEKYYATNELPNPAPEIMAREAKNFQRTFNEKILRLKEGGQDLEIGFRNMPGAKKMGIDQFNLRLAKSDTLRSLGDNTIAPYYNTLMKSLRNSRLGKKFNEFSDLETLAKKDPLAAATHSRVTDLIGKYSERILAKGGQDIGTAEWMREWLDEIGPEKENELLNAYEHGTLASSFALHENLFDVRARSMEESQKIQDTTNSMIRKLDANQYMNNIMKRQHLEFKIDTLKKAPEKHQAEINRLTAERDKIISDIETKNIEKTDEYTAKYDEILKEKRRAEEALGDEIADKLEDYQSSQNSFLKDYYNSDHYKKALGYHSKDYRQIQKELGILQAELGAMLEKRKQYRQAPMNYNKKTKRKYTLLAWEKGEFDKKITKWLNLDEFKMKTNQVKPSVVKGKREIDEVTDEVVKTVDLDDDTLAKLQELTPLKRAYQRALETGVFEGRRFDDVERKRFVNKLRQIDKQIKDLSPDEVIKEKETIYRSGGYNSELDDFILHNRFAEAGGERIDSGKYYDVDYDGIFHTIPTGEQDASKLKELSEEVFLNPEEKIRFVDHLNDKIFNGLKIVPKDAPDEILTSFYKSAKSGNIKEARDLLATFVAMEKYDRDFFRRVNALVSKQYLATDDELIKLYEHGQYKAPRIKASLSWKKVTPDYQYEHTVDNALRFHVDSGKRTIKVMRDGKMVDIPANIDESFDATIPYSEVLPVLHTLRKAIANGQSHMIYGSFKGVSVNQLTHNMSNIAKNLGADPTWSLADQFDYLEQINPHFFIDYTKWFNDAKQDVYDWARGTGDITSAKRKTRQNPAPKVYKRNDSIFDESFDRTKTQNELIEEQITDGSKMKLQKSVSYTDREVKLGDNEQVFGEGWEEIFQEYDGWIRNSLGENYKNIGIKHITQFKRILNNFNDELFGVGGELTRQIKIIDGKEKLSRIKDPYQDLVEFAEKKLKITLADGSVRPVSAEDEVLQNVRSKLSDRGFEVNNKERFEKLSFDDQERITKAYVEYNKKQSWERVKKLTDEQLNEEIKKHKDTPVGKFLSSQYRSRIFFNGNRRAKEAYELRHNLHHVTASSVLGKEIKIENLKAVLKKLESEDANEILEKLYKKDKNLQSKMYKFSAFNNHHVTEATDDLNAIKTKEASFIKNNSFAREDPLKDKVVQELNKMIKELESKPPLDVETAINDYQKQLDELSDWEMSPEVIVNWKDVLSEEMGVSLDRLDELLKYAEDDKVMEFYKLFNDRMSEIGEAEVKAGRLKQDQLDALRGRYMPHIVTEEAKEFFMKMWNPDDNGKYNPKVLGLQKAFDQSRKFHTIEEANTYLAEKQLFKDHGVKKVFETNIAEIYMQRCLGSNKLLFGDEVTNYIKKELCTPFEGTRTHDKVVVHYEDLQKIIKKRLFAENDPKLADKFDTKYTSVSNIYARLGLDERFIGPNMPFIELTDDQIKIMHEINVSPKLFKPYNMHDTVFDRVNHMSRTQEQMLESDMLLLFDKLQGHWKLWNTIVVPGFHSQNAVSNAFQSFLAIGSDAFNPVKLKRAYNIMRTADFKQSITLGGKRYTYKELTWLASESGVLDNTFFKKDLTQDLHEFLPYKVGTKIGTNIEGVQRFNLFLSLLDEGKTVNEAVDGVNQFLFDYADLTDFERKVMRRIIPFYTFMRKNIPLMLNQMLEQPQTFKAFERGFAEMENNGNTEYIGENQRNEWRQEYIQLPWEVDGETYGISDQLPYNQFERVFDAEKLFGQTSPLIKAPVELATGKYSYTQMPVESTGEYMMNQLWPTKVANMTSKKDGSTEKLAYILGQAIGFPIGTINEVADNPYNYPQR